MMPAVTLYLAGFPIRWMGLEIKQEMIVVKFEKEKEIIEVRPPDELFAVTYFFDGFFLLFPFFFAATKLRLRRVVFNNT